MTGAWSTVRRRWAWTAGVLVLAAVVGVTVWTLQSDRRVAARLQPSAPPAPAAVVAPVPLPPAQTVAKGGTAATVRGIVRGPDGRPASGATVVVYRLTSTWPEWRRDPLESERALTGDDGVFQFRRDDLRGLLVSVTRPQFAESLVEVPLHGEVDVRLEPGFQLEGVVTNDAGAPIANARVALESIPGDSRRAVVRTTNANGAYRFTNLPAGPARLVARHEAWQPTTLPAVVVGDIGRADLRFSRPALSALKGRVVVAGGNAAVPVEGATVELLPLNGKLGLVDTQSVRSDKNGEFTISGLARGSMRLFVRHPDHGAVMTTQTVGVTAPPLVVELPRRSRVVGRVAVDSGPWLWRGGEPLQLRDAAGQVSFATIEPDGSFQFPAALSPGWANLLVLEQPFAFQRSYTTEVDVRIEEAMTTELDLVVVKPTILRGRLVDERGQALAGASLMRTKLLAEGARTITDAAAQLDLGMVGSQVAQLFTSDRDELLATTDKAGNFEIRAVKPGGLLVRAAMPGFGSRLLRQMVGAVGSDKDLGTIVLPRGARLQGQVLRGGRPFAGATVLVVGENEAQAPAVATTDGLGAFMVDDLMPGDYRVRARLPSPAVVGRARFERVRVGNRPTIVSIALDAGRTLRGEVLGSDGQAVAGALVSVRGVAGVSATSDSNGEFSLELPERAVDLQVALADRSSSTTVAVPVKEQRLSVLLDTPPTCTITATIAGLPGRKRLPAAVLRLTREDGDGETRSRWIDLPEGELRWPLCPTGRVRIEVWCDGYAPANIEKDLTANDEHRLGELLLEPGCRLAGIVKRADGTAVGNALVMLGEESDLDLYEASTRTAADGSFRISGVSGRSRTLVVRATGFAPRVVELSLPGDVLMPSPLPITLEEGASIEVTVPRALAREGRFVQLRRDGRFVANVELADDGRVVFGNRSAGTYSVALVGDARPPKLVVVATGMKSVRVQLP